MCAAKLCSLESDLLASFSRRPLHSRLACCHCSCAAGVPSNASALLVWARDCSSSATAAPCCTGACVSPDSVRATKPRCNCVCLITWCKARMLVRPSRSRVAASTASSLPRTYKNKGKAAVRTAIKPSSTMRWLTLKWFIRFIGIPSCPLHAATTASSRPISWLDIIMSISTRISMRSP